MAKGGEAVLSSAHEGQNHVLTLTCVEGKKTKLVAFPSRTGMSGFQKAAAYVFGITPQDMAHKQLLAARRKRILTRDLSDRSAIETDRSRSSQPI